MGVGIVLFLGGFGVRVTQSKKKIYNIYIYSKLFQNIIESHRFRNVEFPCGTACIFAGA